MHTPAEQQNSHYKMDEEFDNFMSKVAEVEDVVRKLRSSNEEIAENAKRRADIMLRSNDSEKVLDDSRFGNTFCTTNRTIINQKAFDKLGKPEGTPEMTKDAFMAQVERDAENRAKDKRERRKRSDEISSLANHAFRENKFEKALDLYNKAIDETRDRCALYENRALTYLRLQLYRRTVADCDWALRLNENSLKALLYKSKALFWLGDKKKSENCIEIALEKHPQHTACILDYKKINMEET